MGGTIDSSTAHATFRAWARAERARRRDDPHRPRYHFLPPRHWMNDPNGLLWWRGRTHLFYQHHPHGPLWADMHWGHAVSRDLVHWDDLPVALAPTPDSPDQDGVFSGGAVDRDGIPTIVYSGVRGTAERVCLATAEPVDDDLVTWRKYPGNPVIPAPPAGLDLVAYRDPSPWRGEDGAWYLVHGAGLRGVGGAALLYRSPDLVAWEYLGPLHVGDLTRRDPVWTGSLWECPQIFPLADRHVLLSSVWHEQTAHYAAWATGRFDGRRFAPEREDILDPGSVYAPQTFRHDDGRRILFGWLREGRRPAAMEAAGWSGVMSLPWVLTLGPDHVLRAAPAAELTGLRRAHARVDDLALGPDGERALPGIAGDCLELDAEFEPGRGGRVGLTLRRSPGGEEQTRVVYEPASGKLELDRRRSSLDATVDTASVSASLPLAAGDPLRLRCFLDRSVLEVFADDRRVLTTRLYPTRADSLGVGAFAEGGAARLRHLDAWTMASIWPDDGAP